jgi:hypothetical protein
MLKHLDVVSDAKSNTFCVCMVAVEEGSEVCNESRAGEIFPSFCRDERLREAKNVVLSE